MTSTECFAITGEDRFILIGRHADLFQGVAL